MNTTVAGQSEVNLHFDRAADYWRDVYTRVGVTAQIYRDRQTEILRLLESLSPPEGTRILEVGCGAGRMAVALARRGFIVDAVDSVGRMVRITREFSIQSGVERFVRTELADVNCLGYADEEFPFAIAAGVTPWLPSLETPLKELARVLRPGGYLAITADNKLALSRLLDPVARVSQAGGALLHFAGLRSRGPVVRMYSPARFNAALHRAGFEIVCGRTIGFGPFTLARRELLPDAFAIRLNTTLQEYADRRTPVIRARGRQYIVLARKGSNNDERNHESGIHRRR
jgi:ubiquinone/menaquinone biosynthesis C-methylase UbiE